GPQVGVAAQQRRGGGAQRVHVEGAAQVEHDLRGVDVLLRVVQGVEEQALLQRGQREDVLKLRPAQSSSHSPSSSAASSSISSWLTSTSDRSDGVNPPTGPPDAPSTTCATSPRSAANQRSARSRTSSSPSRPPAHVQVADSSGPSGRSRVCALTSTAWTRPSASSCPGPSASASAWSAGPQSVASGTADRPR